MDIISNRLPNGECSRCGECCGAVPMPFTKKEAKRMANYIIEHNIIPEPLEQDGDNIYLRCCFYNKTTKSCNIYPVRPEMCRVFRCDQSMKLIDKHKTDIHARAYFNHTSGGTPTNVTNFLHYFYGDISHLIMYFKSQGVDKEQILFILNNYGLRKTLKLSTTVDINSQGVI